MGTAQVDSARIKKRLSSIMTRLSQPAVTDLFRPCGADAKMRKVPLKSENPAATETGAIGDANVVEKETRKLAQIPN